MHALLPIVTAAAALPFAPSGGATTDPAHLGRHPLSHCSRPALDLDTDGDVDGADLAILLGAWSL